MGLEEMTGQLLGSMMSHRGSLIASGVELAALTEKYAGSCAITKAFAELDCRVLFFDVIYGEAHDCTKPKGLRRWLLSKALMKIGSLNWMALVCSSWVFLSRSVTKRSRRNPSGSDFVPSVKLGNTQANLLAFELVVDEFMGITDVVEQPLSSELHWYKSTGTALDLRGTDCVVTWLGAFGADTPKPIKLWFSPGAEWVKQLRCKRPTCTLRIARNVKGKITGIKKMCTLSSAYPIEFGKKVAALYVSQKR